VLAKLDGFCAARPELRRALLARAGLVEATRAGAACKCHARFPHVLSGKLKIDDQEAARRTVAS
jgi:hypothetical protein